MAEHTHSSLSLQSVARADINALAKISGDAFLTDRQTQMKALGKTPFVMEDAMKSGLAYYLRSEDMACIKAIDNETGEPMGWCCFTFRGFEKDEIAQILTERGMVREPLQKEETPTTRPAEKKAKATQQHEGDEDDIIKRLEAVTNADMKRWMDILMPEGTKCMNIGGLYVSPNFQRRGIASALLKWGLEIADAFGVFIWVHSSDDVGAVKAYEKHGFEVVGILDVNLDQYAPAPPPEDSNALWGHYIFRYMKRLPRTCNR